MSNEIKKQYNNCTFIEIKGDVKIEHGSQTGTSTRVVFFSISFLAFIVFSAATTGVLNCHDQDMKHYECEINIEKFKPTVEEIENLGMQLIKDKIYQSFNIL